MNDETRHKTGFPPGAGWIPLTLAVVIALLASTFALRPQFDQKVVGLSNPNGQSGQAPGSSTDPNAVGPAQGNQSQAGPGSTSKNGVVQKSGSAVGAADCAKGQNGGATAPGVTGSEIVVTTTKVTTGTGASFLGEATNGIQAAINEVNSGGGICGRRVVLGKKEDGTEPTNTGWDATEGGRDINNYISTNKVFALVGEPDSQGLSGAIGSQSIDRAQIPVVGTDGMLKDQYNDPWVWPVASSTVTNMHIAAKYGVDHNYSKIAIVYDTKYNFGGEGATAFKNELNRLGRNFNGTTCQQGYCAISADNQSGGYLSEVNALDSYCSPCDMVVALLEPGPMQTWMKTQGSSYWYKHLLGGEPLFDDRFAGNCQGCAGNATSDPLLVWTGYRPPIQPFDSESAVNRYKQSLLNQCPSCDPNNEFTEGAYLGTRLFIEAAKLAGPNLTRQALRDVLNSHTFDLGLSAPLQYGALPHQANRSMAAFKENATGSTFHDWSYLQTGFLQDPAPGKDLN